MGHAGAYSNTVHTLPRDVVIKSVLQYRIYTNRRSIVTFQATISLRVYILTESPYRNRITWKMSENGKKDVQLTC